MKLRNAPLVHVLAQVSFPRLINPGYGLEALRKGFQAEGFPRFVEGSLHRVTIMEGAPPQVAVSPRWDFLSRDTSEAVQVTDQGLVLRTMRYSSIEPFLQRLGSVLGVIASAVEIQLVDRLGLRYIDRISPREGERVHDYVQPGLVAFPFQELKSTAAELQATSTESIARTPMGVLAVRTRLLSRGELLPPDLTPSPLREPDAVPDVAGLSLDFDHFATFQTDPFDFDAGAVIGRMRELHTGLREAFDVAVTPHALEVWGPWEEA